ncbi:hypothetical protein [Pseudonocardia oceani]|uniref:hypothetical protein n=1 Tax=Pseudonocardia oceani TaxID=2792013 RepID=UPI003556F2E4
MIGNPYEGEFVEVFGQRKLLKWSVPGLAHLFTFYAFVILITVYPEAYGALSVPDFAIPLIGTWPVLGYLPYESGAWASIGLGRLFAGVPEPTLEVIESVGLLLPIGVMLVFTVMSRTP